MFPGLSFLWHRFEICICCGKNFKHFFFSRLLPCHERRTLSPQHWRQALSSRERGSKELRWADETFLGVKINSEVFMWMEFVQPPISVSNQTSLHPRLGRRWKTDLKGWRMVKSETRRDAATLVRNPSPRLFGKKFRDSKKVKTNHAKTRLRDLSKTFPRFRDPVKIFRDLRLSRYHSPPLLECVELQAKQSHQCVMHFTRGGGGTPCSIQYSRKGVPISGVRYMKG